jgi:D-alanyl-D-alanine carboxypeptidase
MLIKRIVVAAVIGCSLFTLQSCFREEIPEPQQVICGADYSGHPSHSRYTEALRQYTDASAAPGSIIGVKKIGEPAWVGTDGYSNLEHRTKISSCTPFRSGSISKLFTAVMIMKFVENGQLTLDKTIAQLLPEISDRISKADKITVRQLLNHTSGLGHPTDDDRNYQLTLINNPNYIASLTYKERLERYVFDRPLHHEPGTDSYYSNAGYWVLGLMIEKLSGQRVEEYLNTAITQPLGLTETYLARRENSRVSRGYNFSGDVLQDVTKWDSADSDGDPAAGLISTAEDLLTFSEALFTYQILQAPTLNLMLQTTSFPSCNGDCGYGLGIESWKTESNFGYGKNGFSMGVDANIIFFPNKNTSIVIFSNFGGGNSKECIDKILQ